MNYRKTLGILLAIVIAPLALAAPPRGDSDFGGAWGEGPGGREGMERGQAQRIERLIEFLELSDAQTLEIEEIMSQQREARKASFQTMRADGEALRTLIDSENPDATLVGQKVLAMHAARKASRAQGEADLERIRGVLTPEQAERFDVLMEAREMRGERGERHRPGRRGQRGQRRGGPGGDGPPTDG